MRTMKKHAWTSRGVIMLAALGAMGLGPAACSDTLPAPSPEMTAERQGAVRITIAPPTDSGDASEQSSKGSGAAAGAGEQPSYQTMSASYTDVASILINVTSNGQPLFVNFALEEGVTGAWSGEVPFLPFDVELTFTAIARDAAGAEIFSGTSIKTFDGTDQAVGITLAASDDGATYELPRCEQISVPVEFLSGESNSIGFYLRGQTNETLTYAITSAANGGSFSPLNGQVTLVGTSASLFVEYTAPVTAVATTFTHTILITNSDGNAISTTFSTNVVPDTVPDGEEVDVDVTFNPSILSLGGHRVDGSDQVTWTAAVSDDQGVAGLTYQWGFTPDGASSFAPLAGQEETNPSTFGGYASAVEGLLTLSVTDGDGGTTTLYYNILENLFPENVVFDSNGLAEVKAGGEHTCARFHNGVVRCWGRNNVGQLGLGNTIDIGDTELPSSVVSNATIAGEAKQVVTGRAHTCALLKTGLVYCWGNNTFGQLGYSNTNNLGDGELVQDAGYVPLTGPAVRLAAGGDHTCAVMSTGNAICWGRNSHGQLGYGTTLNVGDNEFPYQGGNVPINSAGQSFTVKDLALGSFHTCALLSNDTVKCWGRNEFGQLGYGNVTPVGATTLPSSVGAVNVGGPVQKVVAGDMHTCALLKTGVVRCWGRNDLGQLGNGTVTHWNGVSWVYLNIGDNELPTANGQAVNFNNANLQVVDLAAGAQHSCAIVGGGGVRCWGQGTNGKLGYGNVNTLLTPGGNVNMSGNSATRVTAGAEHSCVFLTNGAARCWGLGAQGQLGYGTTQSVGDGELPSSSPSISDISIVAP